MAAMTDTLHRFYLPILLIGFATGLLSLIPQVGWLLGFFAFVLAYRYAQRKTFMGDLLIIMLVWLIIRQLALAFHM